MLGTGRDPEEDRVHEAAHALVSEHETSYEPLIPSQKVLRHSVRGQVLDALRAALVDGELVPGEIYSGPALGERFGVSATPVREAMQQLALEGAVECLPNRGFRVLTRTPRSQAELSEVRALIEVPVMLRLARSVPAATWESLRPAAVAAAEAAEEGDLPRYAEADRAFHRAVLSLSGNGQLVRIAEELHRRAQWPLPGAPRVRRGDLVADAAEHSALLDALAAQDLGAVEALVRAHFAGA
ncbi:GntR family transcriptional regulator [Streptomyces sp. NPDC127110]|uniref:GntR family transcriptional regulator n=1 Tax=Streptomyces sp. NPDC127110 TaxID=3345362 RepID=UPI00362AEBCB